MKRLLLPVVLVAAVGMGLAATASADNFVASPSISIGKVPSGPTARGERIVIFGKVSSARRLCKNDRVVRLFKVRRGTDRLLATDRTDSEGEYGFTRRPGGDQRVYTRIGRLHVISYGHDHVCRSARSSNQRINVN